jgi:PadR family transcriptional regulator PadR
MKSDNSKAQMRKGVLELCIMAIIARENEMYPSDIIARLKETELIVVEGTLYPMLTRLKNEGLLQYTWRESRTGPPRKYFQATEDGRQFLEEIKSDWAALVRQVQQITSELPRQQEAADIPNRNQNSFPAVINEMLHFPPSTDGSNIANL